MDLESYSKDFINNMHRVLAVLYKKQNQTSYNPGFANLVSEIFYKQMNIQTGLAAIFFFYLFALNYIPSDSEGYSMLDKMIMNLNQLNKNLHEKQGKNASLN